MKNFLISFALMLLTATITVFASTQEFVKDAHYSGLQNEGADNSTATANHNYTDHTTKKVCQ